MEIKGQQRNRTNGSKVKMNTYRLDIKQRFLTINVVLAVEFQSN